MFIFYKKKNSKEIIVRFFREAESFCLFVPTTLCLWVSFSQPLRQRARVRKFAFSPPWGTGPIVVVVIVRFFYKKKNSKETFFFRARVYVGAERGLGLGNLIFQPPGAPDPGLLSLLLLFVFLFVFCKEEKL